MIIRLTFKTPDILDQVRQQIWEEVWSCPDYAEEDMQSEYEWREEDIMPILKEIVEYGEYITIEIDTFTKQTKVIK